MESNGVRGRIHVSQETANELISKGKGSWLSPREDKIVAKGKGELQTYWVNPRDLAVSVSRSDSMSGGLPSVSDNDVFVLPGSMNQSANPLKLAASRAISSMTDTEKYHSSSGEISRENPFEI